MGSIYYRVKKKLNLDRRPLISKGGEEEEEEEEEEED
jgi:hypothetical protein